MPTSTTVNNLKINKLTKAQYDDIQSPSETELYLVEESIDTTPTNGSENPVSSGGVYTALSGKANSNDLATVATSGSYNDLSNTPTIPDVSGKEDKMAIDSTAKTASFTATVGNYYTVNIAASGSITITLTTPSDSTHVSSALFFVTTSTSPALTFSAASGVTVYKASSYSIEASKVYEVNALWNGTAWSIASVELEAQS